jgi:small subunit ribosomal protein S19
VAKEFKWKGRTEEELKVMDMKEFMGLISSRARRSLKRGLTDDQKKLMKSLDSGANNVKTHCRNMVILPSMIGKTIRIHNGKDYTMLIITVEMLGHVFGEFSHTRKSVTHSSAGVGATRSSKAISAR